MNWKTATQEEKNNCFIDKANKIHSLNMFGYELVEYKNAITDVKIKCNTCGVIFDQTPNDHLSGKGCRVCAINRRASLCRHTLNMFIAHAIEIHGDKYDYSYVIYTNARTNVIIRCKEHDFKFLQTPDNHLHGKGCKYCGIKKQVSKRTTTLDEFIQESINIYGKDMFGYSEVKYSNNRTKVILTCKINNHRFEQAPWGHLNGDGCPKCLGYLLTTDDIIRKFNSIEGNADLYDYIKVTYVDSYTPIIIICKKCGEEFPQMPGNHLRGGGHGCPRCSGKNKTTEIFLSELMSLKDYSNNIDLSLVNYINNNTNVILKCNTCNRKFKRTPSGCMNSLKCPHCIRWISQCESEFLDYCGIPIDMTNRQYRVGRYKCDGYDDKTNTIYEYLGDYWHGNPETQTMNNMNKIAKNTFQGLYDKTFARFDKLKILGYNLKYIWENDWKRFKDGISETPNIITY